LATSYGILDTLNKQIAIPESLLISDFIEGLIISEKASLKIMKISGLDTIAVNASENIMLDSDMEIWVTAEDSSIRSYDLVFPESTSNGGLNDEHEWDIVLLQKNGFVEINSSQPISHVKIYNLQGKLLIQEKFDTQRVEFDIAALNNGAYLVEVMIVRGKKAIRKFIY